MVSWITDMLSATGYAGVLFLMFIENIFPPIPSELIMPFAGFIAARGDLNPVGVVVAGTFGSVLGALPWYGAAWWLGKERLKRFADRYGRWLTMTSDDVETADAWFDRHGHKAVLVGRLVPTVRTLISVPAGLSHMRLAPFLLYSTIGTAVWVSLLAGAGYLLEDQWQSVAGYVKPAANVVAGMLVLGYLYRVATFRRHG